MPEAISIDALLRLNTQYAVKQLATLGKNQKPITIPINYDAKKIGGVFAEITASAISSKLKSSFESIGNDLVSKIEDAFTKSKVKVGGGGLLGGLTNIITAPLQSIARGAFEGVGQEVSRKFGMGLSKGIEAQASQFIGSFDLLGEKLITKVVPNLTDSAIAQIKSTAIGQQLAEAMKDFDINEARNNLKERFKDLLGDSDLLIEQEFQAALTRKARGRKKVTAQKEVAQQLITELQQQPKQELRNKAIAKQIEQLEKQNIKEQELIAKVTEKFKPDKENVKLFNELNKKLESRTKQVSNLQFLIEKQEAVLSRLQKADQRAEQARQLIGETREKFKKVTGIAGKEDEAKRLAQQIKRQKEILAQALKDRARRPQLETEANKEIQELKQQIAQVIKEGQPEKEALAKVQKKLEFDLKTLNSIRATRDKIAARKEQIAKLTQEQQKIFRPVAQQKLARLGIDTTGISRVQEKADETAERLRVSIETLEERKEERKEAIKTVEKGIENLERSAKRIGFSLNQEIQAQTSLQGTPLFDPSIANLLQKQFDITTQKVDLSKKQLIQLFKDIKGINEKIAKTEETVGEISNEKLLASLQQQIAVIQKVTKKSAIEIAKAIALGQGQTLQRSIDTARRQAERNVAVINSNIEKGSSINEAAIAKGEAVFEKTALNKIIERQKALKSSSQKLLKEKSELVKQRNKGKDVADSLKEVEKRIDTETKELTKIRKQLQRVESKTFGGEKLDKKRSEIIKRISQLRQERTKLIARQDTGENVSQQLEDVENNLKKELKSLKQSEKEIKEAGEKYYETLELSRYLKTQRLVLNTSKKAAANLNKAQQLVEDIEEQAVGEIQKLQERTQRLISALKPLTEPSKNVVKQNQVQAKTEISFAQDLTNKIAQQIEKLTSISFQNIPAIVSGTSNQGSAQYEKASNEVRLPSDLFELLDKDKFSQLTKRQQELFIEAISHELRHALQEQVKRIHGSFEKIVSAGNFFLAPNEQESARVASRIETSVSRAMERGYKAETIETLRTLETDAYTFAVRYFEQIHDQLNLTFKKGAESLQQQQEKVIQQVKHQSPQLENLLSRIKPIALPLPPAISSRAFPVIESSQDLQQLLEKQISASGLREIVKRLGLGTDSPIKKVAIERVVNAYKQDALKVQELIARFGDDIRLKAAKTGAGASFGKIEDETVLTDAFKQNQKILKEAYLLLDDVSEDQRKVLARQIQAIALEQVETIDRITREFKVAAHTGQSLAGTRSQLTNINDSLISVTKGIATGVNQETESIEKQGHKAGEAFKQGFDESLGIKSPAREFIKKMIFVVQGIEKGATNLSSRIRSSGELLGANLLQGFRTKLKIKSPSDESKKDMINVIQGIIIAAEISFNRLRKLGVRLGDEILVGFAKSKIAQGKIADKASKQIEKEVTKLEQQNQKATNTVINRIKNNLKTAEQILTQSSKQLSRQEQQIEQENTNFIARVQSRIFRNQGIGNAPIQPIAETTDQKGIIDQVKLAITSIQNDLRNAGLKNANKEAEKVVKAAKDLLSNLQVTVTVGQDAGEKIKQSLNAIASLEKEQAKIIKGIGKLKGAEKLKVKAEVDRIQAQIQDEQERVAAFKAQQAEAKKLLPIYNQLTNLNDQLQRAVANQDIRGIRRLNREINQVFEQINQPPPGSGSGLLGRITQQLERIGITGRRVATMLKGLAALAVGSIFVGGLDDAVRQITSVTTRFEQLETAINFTAGSSEAGAKKLEFLRNESNRLKIDIETATKSFKGLAAAARGTALEQETEKIFSSVAQASRVFGLTAEQTDGALLALTQIISKGTVQAEELRGQLGERLPGAFQIAARSMNVTTAELGKLLETGQVTAEEFLPKFAAQLEKETRPGLAQSLRTVSAAIQGVQNEFTQLQLAIGKATSGKTVVALGAVEKGLKLIRENLNLIIPVVKATVSLLAIALLPAALQLGKFLLGAAKVGLNQVINLLGITNGQLLLTNSQLTLLAAKSPKLAALVGALNKISVALKLAAAAAKAFLIIETISVLTDTFGKTAKAGQEVRDSVAQIDDAFKKLQTTLATQKTDNLLPENLTEKITEQNRKNLRENQNYFQKTTDAVKKFDRQLTGLVGLESFLGLTFEEAELSRIEKATGDAIAANQKLLQEADKKLGLTDVTDKTTEELQGFVDAIETYNQALQKTRESAVNPAQINAINKELDANQERLDKYNKELERREDRELNLAKIIIAKKDTITAATQAETEALANIDEEMLKSGDFKKDVELQKLQYAKTRIDAELDAEKEALNKIQQLATEKGGIDLKTGKPKDAKQLADLEKTQKRINELQRAAVENRISLVQKETEQKIAEYDRYLEEIESRSQKAEDIAVSSEKERLIEIQQLINDGVITTETAEDLKANATRDRITSELTQEKDKLYQLKKFKTDEVEAREKADNDIKTNRQKILDLTLQLLEQEKQAEERTINAIARARDNVFSALERRFSNLQQLYNTQAQLDSDRASADQRLADLELSKLRQALNIKQQLNNADLDQYERQTLIRQLTSLGLKGRTDELSLLNRIEDREEKLAKLKLQNLEKQQQLQQNILEVELQQLELTTKKAKLEAAKQQRTAQQELVSAEKAIAQAETPEELATANELYDLAQQSLDLANQEFLAAKYQLDNLDSIIAKKRENLALTQAIAKAELEGTTVDEQFEQEKARNKALEERDRRKAETKSGSGRDKLLEQYLSRQEKIDQKIEAKKTEFEAKGIEFTEQDETKERANLNRQFEKKEVAQERKTKRSLLGSPGFSIEAPPEILEAIKTGKPFVVPVVPQVKSNVPKTIETIGKTKGSLNKDETIFNLLKSIDQKFKQPTVVNVTNDNQFVNQYQRNNEDEILRKTRSDLLEIVSSAMNDNSF